MSIFPSQHVQLIMERAAVSGAVADFDFTPIPGNFRNLELELVGRGTRLQVNDSWTLEINGDTGNSYTRLVQWQAGKVETFTPSAPAVAGYFTWTPAANSPAGWMGNVFIKFFQYANPNAIKTWQSRGFDPENNVANAFFIYDAGGTWHSTSPISRIRLYPTNGQIAQFSSAQLYGLL